MISQRGIALTAAWFGLLAVILAAAGSHLVPQDAATAQKLWATALRMHLFHTVALLGIAALLKPDLHRLMPWSAASMAVGMVLFSGSLYLKAGGFITDPGMVTPLGGMMLMAAWLLLIMTLIRKSQF